MDRHGLLDVVLVRPGVGDVVLVDRSERAGDDDEHEEGQEEPGDPVAPQAPPRERPGAPPDDRLRTLLPCEEARGVE